MGREEKFPSSGVVPAYACWACYIAVEVGFAVLFLFPQHQDPWMNGLLASVETTVLVWVFSYVYHNTSLYDPYWCFYPVSAAIGWMATSSAASQSMRGWLALGLMCLWWFRYNAQWTWEGWTIGIHTEDWRYLLMARKLGLSDSTGFVYWFIVSLIGAHIVPTLLVWSVLGPVQHIWTMGADGAPALCALDLLGVAVSLSGPLLQYISDKTLYNFRVKRMGTKNIETASCGQTCREGPWAYSRHPNYLGEVLFWLGMSIMAFAGDSSEKGVGPFWAWCGIIFYAIFFRISSSLMDARSLRNRPGYAQVMEDTPAMLPLPIFVDRILDKVLISSSDMEQSLLPIL